MLRGRGWGRGLSAPARSARDHGGEGDAFACALRLVGSTAVETRLLSPDCRLKGAERAEPCLSDVCLIIVSGLSAVTDPAHARPRPVCPGPTRTPPRALHRQAAKRTPPHQISIRAIASSPRRRTTRTSKQDHVSLSFRDSKIPRKRRDSLAPLHSPIGNG